MAPLSGISTDSISHSARGRRYSSDSVVGLGSILHDQKIFYRTTQASVLLGLTTQIISTPAFDATASLALNDLIEGGNETDDLKEEDIWAMGLRSSSDKRTSVSSRDKQKLLGISQGHHMYETESKFVHENGYDYHCFPDVARKMSESTLDGFRATSQSQAEKGCNDLTAAFGNPTSEAPSLVSKSSDVRRSMPITMPSPSRSISFHNMHYVKRTSVDDLVHRQSAPVNVPDWSKILKKEVNRMHKNDDIRQSDDDYGDENVEEKIPPHELLAREQAHSGVVTFSVCEGQGRTLKGRDVCRMRNAVWKKIGFAD